MYTHKGVASVTVAVGSSAVLLLSFFIHVSWHAECELMIADQSIRKGYGNIDAVAAPAGKRTRSQSISTFWNSGADSNSWCVCVLLFLVALHLVPLNCKQRLLPVERQLLVTLKPDAIIISRLITYPLTRAAGPVACYQASRLKDVLQYNDGHGKYRKRCLKRVCVRVKGKYDRSGSP